MPCSNFGEKFVILESVEGAEIVNVPFCADPHLMNPFHPMRLQAFPALAAAHERYLSQALVETRPDDRVQLVVPTSFHVGALEKLRPDLERFLGASVGDIIVRRSEISQRAATPSPGIAPETQTHLPFARAQRQIDDPRELERKQRITPPPFVNSKAFNANFQLCQRWVEGLNRGQKSQALWLYGESGSGKTTLLRQFHEWLDLSLNLKQLDIMKFFHEWRRSLEDKDHLSFVRRYRKETSVLILENIDDLQGKIKTQQEVLFTVSAILDKGGSIAISSQRHPLEIKELLEPALYSRLYSGLLLETPKPDRDFKEFLWRRLLSDYGLAEVPMDIKLLDRLLSIPVNTSRKANTLFINAIGRLSLKKELTHLDLAELENMHGPTVLNRPGGVSGLTPQEILDRVAQLCGINRAAVMGKNRRSDVSLARRFICLSLARFGGLTNSAISHMIEKDPSTISHALKTLEQDLKTDRVVAEQWNWIASQLGMPLAGRVNQV